VVLGRASHAYLFSGPRGTGKTSTARILAKALNCRSLAPGAEPPAGADGHGEPDNTCHFCQAVNQGRALDLIEMDAASHRGIDDVRNLRERVFGAGPAEGRCKVYIIDEAHMLTEPAFNALLKTLEEPAPWAYFVLCTTEPHKIPATVASRCQRFDFRRINTEDVLRRLETICQGEKVEAEPEALRAITRAAWGSLRDACNLLEQAIVAAGSPVTLATVEELLGLSRDANALQLVRHALAGGLADGLGVIHGVASAGTDLRAFHRDVVEFLRAVLLVKSGAPGALDYPADVLKEVQEIAAGAPLGRVFQAVKLFSQVSLRSTEAPSTLPLELALVECTAPTEGPVAAKAGQATRPPSTAPAPPSARVERAPAPRAAPRPEPQTRVGAAPPRSSMAPPRENPPGAGVLKRDESERRVQPTPPATAHRPAEPTGAPAPSHPPPLHPDATPSPSAGSVTDLQWDALCKALKRIRGNKFVLGSLLLDCRQRRLEGDSLVLLFKNPSHRERLEDELQHPPSQRAVQEAIRAAFGRDYTLRLAVEEGNGSPEQSGGHLVRAAMALGAKVVEPKEERR
jgi:DNA polymerase-3 subunit gamma/tau